MVNGLIRILLVMILLLTSIFSISGCHKSVVATEQQLGSTWDEILARAKEEGTVTIYSQLETTQTIPVLVAAMKKYGIVLKNQPLYYREVMAKVSAEAAANVHICDVVSMSLGYMLVESNSNYYDDYKVLPNIQNPIINGKATSWTIDPQKYPYGYVYSMGAPYGITCNTNNLASAGIAFPQTWKSLAGNDYYGRIVMSDPTRPGSGFRIIAAQLYYGPMGINGTGVFNRDWLKGVLKNMYIARNMTTIPGELIDGRHTVYFPSRVETPFGELAENNAFPIGWRYPDEGVYLSPLTLIPVKGAEHPNAAYVLLNYIFSEEGQMAIAAGLNIPNMAGLGIPEQYKNVSSKWGNYADAMYGLKPLEPYPQDIYWVKEKEESMGDIINEIKNELEAIGEWNN